MSPLSVVNPSITHQLEPMHVEGKSIAAEIIDPQSPVSEEHSKVAEKPE
jgi:hypothetical protein